MPRTVPALVFAGLALGLPEIGHAQSRCQDRDALVRALENRYAERLAGAGLRDERAVFEVWTSDDSGTWTILLTRPDGTSCVMASGTNWRNALPSERLPGSPS